MMAKATTVLRQIPAQAQQPMRRKPVAAALIVGAPPPPPPAPANTAAAATPSAAVGGVTKERTRSGTIVAGGQDGSPATADATASDQPTGADPTASGAADSAAKQQAASGDASSLQAQTQANTDSAAATTQTDATAPTNTDHIDARSTDPSTASATRIAAESANPPGGRAGVKTDGTGLPNFGFSVATTASSAADSGSTGTTSNAAAVPVAGLAVAIAARAQNGSNQFDIRLDPAELGRIDVRLDVDRDGQVTTHVTADRADTLELLQNQQPQLQQALEQAGLKTADNGLQFTLRDQSFTGQNNGSGYQTNGCAQLVIPDADLAPITATQIYTRAGLSSGVDISV
jgi:flagellar hook-length control protein FliK